MLNEEKDAPQRSATFQMLKCCPAAQNCDRRNICRIGGSVPSRSKHRIRKIATMPIFVDEPEARHIFVFASRQSPWSYEQPLVDRFQKRPVLFPCFYYH